MGKYQGLMTAGRGRTERQGSGQTVRHIFRFGPMRDINCGWVGRQPTVNMKRILCSDSTSSEDDEQEQGS